MSCPICQKAPDAKYRPFCSKRCADVDLGRWLTGSYAIPGEEVALDDLPTSPEEDASSEGRKPRTQ